MAAQSLGGASGLSQSHQIAVHAAPEKATTQAMGIGDGSTFRLSTAATMPPIKNWFTPNSEDAAPLLSGNRLSVLATVLENVGPTPKTYNMKDATSPTTPPPLYDDSSTAIPPTARSGCRPISPGCRPVWPSPRAKLSKITRHRSPARSIRIAFALYTSNHIVSVG